MALDSPLPGVESIMGPMTVMNPVRVTTLNEMTAGDFLRRFQDQLVSTIQYEHKAWATFRERLGAQAILPGMIDWHPLRNDHFSRITALKAPSGKLGYLKPRKDLSENFAINASLLVNIYEHEHHLDLRVLYDGHIWEEKRVIKLIDSFADVLTKMLGSRDCKVEIFC